MSADSFLSKYFREIYSKLHFFLQREIWDIDYRQFRGARRLLVRQFQVILLAIKGMKDDEVRLRASSLSLITLLSVVPFLAVVFWIFQALGGLEDVRYKVEPFIYESLAVGVQEEAVEWFNRFIDQIHAGAVGGIGTGILLVAAIGLLASMEQSFNRVWGVSRGRPWLNRFVIYWCMLTVGPILLATSLAGTATVIGWLPFETGTGTFLLRFLPFFVTIGAFTLFYSVIPNTQVSLKHAFLGGLTAGILFEVAKFGYAWVAGNLFQHNAIYGSLGTVPVFIIWVNIIWNLVLFGCELTYANQNVGTLRHEAKARAAGQKLRESVACRMMLEIAMDYLKGVAPPSNSIISERLDIPSRLVRSVSEVLQSSGLILEASRKRGESGFVPARQLSEITMNEVISAMRRNLASVGDLSEDEIQEFLREKISLAEEKASEIYSKWNFLELAGPFIAGEKVPGTE